MLIRLQSILKILTKQVDRDQETIAQDAAEQERFRARMQNLERQLQAIAEVVDQTTNLNQRR